MTESCVRTDCVHALWASLYSAGWCDTDNDSFLLLTLQLSTRRSALSRHITTEQWCKFACQMWKVLRVVMSIRRIINQICIHGQHPLNTLVIFPTCISCRVSKGSCADLMIHPTFLPVTKIQCFIDEYPISLHVLWFHHCHFGYLEILNF